MLALASPSPPPAGFLAFQCDRDFQRRIEERVARRRVPKQRGGVRDWQLGLGPVTGVAGQTQTVSVMPSMPFRCEKFFATDDAVPQGSGTVVKGIFVGNISQMSGSMPTAFLGANTLGSGIKFSPSQPGIPISVSVEFLKNCTFSAVMLGKALT